MPIIRLNDIREMNPDKRNEKLEELKTELSKMRTLINAGGSLENPGKIRNLRKAIAQIETIKNEENRK
ncbi:50S ribosomal protein L29 [Candidatus Bathyarchaeota archaeon]|nr:50S ribosomal protein L29 [Candidatus Bathyarchaeota archaeon]